MAYQEPVAPPTVHQLKTWPEHFDAVASGLKTFEIRKDDRGFEVGNILNLNEFDPRTMAYTGRMLVALVTYKLAGLDGLDPDYCLLGITLKSNWGGVPA